MSTIIRKMQIGDKPTILSLMKEFYSSELVWSNGSEEIFSNDVDNCIGENPYLEGYVFEDSAEICGYAMVAKSFSTEFGKPCIWLEDLYIHENARGRGIGNYFMKFITEKYADAVFRLDVEAENTAAMKLYQTYGFDVLPYIEMKR